LSGEISFAFALCGRGASFAKYLSESLRLRKIKN